MPAENGTPAIKSKARVAILSENLKVRGLFWKTKETPPLDNHEIGPEEEDRLARLHALQLLDTPREKEFDELADLAAAICGTPIALVSLIDRDRQWFKAATGLDAPETPLSQSVCAYTMLGDKVLEIPDTTADPRHRRQPAGQRR